MATLDGHPEQVVVQSGHFVALFLCVAPDNQSVQNSSIKAWNVFTERILRGMVRKFEKCETLSQTLANLKNLKLKVWKASKRIPSNTRTHAPTHARARALAYAHTYAHTHMHTHTLPLSLSLKHTTSFLRSSSWLFLQILLVFSSFLQLRLAAVESRCIAEQRLRELQEKYELLLEENQRLIAMPVPQQYQADILKCKLTPRRSSDSALSKLKPPALPCSLAQRIRPASTSKTSDLIDFSEPATEKPTLSRAPGSRPSPSNSRRPSVSLTSVCSEAASTSNEHDIEQEMMALRHQVRFKKTRYQNDPSLIQQLDIYVFTEKERIKHTHASKLTSRANIIRTGDNILCFHCFIGNRKRTVLFIRNTLFLTCFSIGVFTQIVSITQPNY